MNEKDYQEAINTLAGWCHEVDNPKISEDKKVVLITCYGAGLEIASILTGASVEQITADVRSAYRKYYQKEENDNNGQ